MSKGHSSAQVQEMFGISRSSLERWRVCMVQGESLVPRPIEMMWSKVKAWLRKQAAEQAITEALFRISDQDTKGWFAHAGYNTYNQLF